MLQPVKTKSWLLFSRHLTGQKPALKERIRGTIWEKWFNYWKSVAHDYNEVAIGLLKGSREKPMRALAYLTSGYGIYQCALHNPDEQVFLERYNKARNDLILVSTELRNPITIDYLQRLQLDLNQQRQRFLSLGLFTIMWEDMYDRDDCTYPAQCEYTKVTFWNFHKRILDIGFWNRFWRLEWNLRNYDVNYL